MLPAGPGARRLGEDAMDRPDDPMAADRTAGGAVVVPGEPLILGMFTPLQVVLAAAAAWLLFGKR